MDTGTIKLKLVLGLLGFIWILGTCNADFTPADNYLINCGSTAEATIGQRVFEADTSSSTILTSPQSITAITTPNSVSGFDNAELYQSARIFAAPSSYAFKIKSRGRHFVRLHFFPFKYQSYDLATANFKVSTQDVVLLNNFTVPSSSSPVFKEYSLNITRDMLILTFVPLGNTTSFINAIEVISVPDNLITDSAPTVNPVGQYLGLSMQPLQTFYRVNVGGPKVIPENDTLWRTWAIDQSFFLNSTATKAVNFPGKLNYQNKGATQEDAPDSVYNTARQLFVQTNTSLMSSMTWQFSVDGRSSYLIRFHFCDIVSKAAYELYFDAYVDSWLASKDLDLSIKGFGNLAVPYYLDIVLPSSDPSGKLSVSIGTSSLRDMKPNGILNGLEIMKMNISTGTVDIVAPPSVAKRHLAVILGSVLGAVVAVSIATVFCIFFRRKKKPQPPRTMRPTSSWTPLNGFSFLSTRSRTTSRTTITSGTASDASYRIPFVVLQDATNHFDEQMVIGIGGFGKVYKAVMQDGSKVAVKRCNQRSHQGLREFQTEIELLSGLRHRHLVSLIGYCDEHNEMILVYEYMEKGTLKSQLYGCEMPPLSWKKRLEICIGAARGLHYLHTGFAKSIIHRDVKSANILLDENLLAKVSDFGLSKVGPEFDQTHVSTAVKGSFGYLDPEYFRRQKLTDKSDVYSFGVVLLEVICARPVIDPTLPRDMINLAEWAIKWQKRGELGQIVDQRIAGAIRPEALRKFGETVEKCLAEYGVERPTMGDVLWNLEFVLQLQEAGPDISNIDSMNQISELPSNAKRVSFLELSTADESRTEIDYSDMSTSNAFSQLIKAEGR
ncbi:receptor-like protein kinase HERK 1 [Phragmites australis]|uniref:receptor-like protein kinase HERK 1 n=1 Tax=Phragmites australis TaxID=29695 RepID=UPI002D764CC2|nr:receptor-like protein kinase HERK 1 [Phragmites australis]XP_062180281.1 receptor-like protein kinase HERK 1 [Phragmites australis]